MVHGIDERLVQCDADAQTVSFVPVFELRL